MPHVLAVSNGRPRSVLSRRLSAISRLSAVATELVAVRQHLTDRDGAGERLDDIVAELDATITALLHEAPASVDLITGADGR
jgi:hypothetical protein